MLIKRIIRNCFRIRNNESFSDGINRHYYHIKKQLPHKMISLSELERILENLGIVAGDVLIVHSSWRAMYMIEATPDDVLNLLISKIGSQGTIVMPCYGDDSTYFDVENTKSVAGLLSELLRNKVGSIRSEFPKFSMVAYGKNALDIVKEHKNSVYQFDEKSPYCIAVHKYNAKVLLMGLGKCPHKISAFHCASYDSRIDTQFYKQCYANNKKATLIVNNEKISIEYVDRFPKYQNDKRVFRKLFKQVKKKTLKKNGLVLTVFNAINAYNIARKYCEAGGKIYKID